MRQTTLAPTRRRAPPFDFVEGAWNGAALRAARGFFQRAGAVAPIANPPKKRRKKGKRAGEEALPPPPILLVWGGNGTGKTELVERVLGEACPDRAVLRTDDVQRAKQSAASEVQAWAQDHRGVVWLDDIESFDAHTATALVGAMPAIAAAAHAVVVAVDDRYAFRPLRALRNSGMPRVEEARLFPPRAEEIAKMTRRSARATPAAGDLRQAAMCRAIPEMAQRDARRSRFAECDALFAGEGEGGEGGGEFPAPTVFENYPNDHNPACLDSLASIADAFSADDVVTTDFRQPEIAALAVRATAQDRCVFRAKLRAPPGDFFTGSGQSHPVVHVVRKLRLDMTDVQDMRLALRVLAGKLTFVQMRRVNARFGLDDADVKVISRCYQMLL